MSAVGALMLLVLLVLLGSLVTTSCELRARDPENEEGGRGRGGGRPEGEMTDNPPAHTGNRCAFVQRRVLTVAVACGTETFTIRSQSSCSSGNPDCQIIYKLSTRPVYRQKHKIFTALQWRCCPGHGGDDCNHPEVPAPMQQQFVDLNREQNDHQGLSDSLSTAQNNLRAEHTRNHPENVLDIHDLHQQNHQHAPEPSEPPVAHIVQLVMSQLRPVLERFNHSLESLSQQVEDLTRSMEQLKSDHHQGDSVEDRAEEPLETSVDQVSQQVLLVRQQVENQRVEVERRLHSQHAMLHYNLTYFKTDIDMKLKRHQKMLQMNLHSINTTLSELKLKGEEPQDLQASDTSVLWKAIEQLDNKVINNTVKVSSLSEDMDVMFGDVQQLRRSVGELEKQMNQTARKSQVLFMETGLEVEHAKVVVLQRVEELSRNLTKQDQQLQEMDVDVDYLYTAIYQHNGTSDCECQGLKAAVAHLQSSLVNVTEIINDNVLALEEREGMGAGSGSNDWQELQHTLQQVQNLVSTEQSRTKNLEQDLVQINSLLLGLQEEERRLAAEMKHLSASFTSLLKDAIRHSEVLELLLGEEVLEFLDWPLQDQEDHSIPALKEQLNILKEQRQRRAGPQGSGDLENVHFADQPSTSSSSFLAGNEPLVGSTSNMDTAPSRERQLLHHMEAGPEGGSEGVLLNLRQKVEEADGRLALLEAGPSSCLSCSKQAMELQTEIGRLKRGLEEHLRVFKTVFTNADVLIASDSVLELEKLWQLRRRKAEKRERVKKGGGKEKQTEGE